MKLSRREWTVHLGVLLLYSLIYFVYTKQYPWLWGEQLFGSHSGDGSQFLWNAYHFEEWTKGNQNYFFTDLIYAPYGSSLVYHTYSHLMTAFSYLIGDSYWSINLIIWLHYAFSGLGAYLLGRKFQLNHWWAFLAGFVFVFIPYKISHLTGHYNLEQTAFIPFFILAFFKVFPKDAKNSLTENINIKSILFIALLGLLCLLSCYLYSVFLFLFVLGYFIYQLIHRTLKKGWMRWGLLVLLTIGSSYLIPYLNEMGLDNKAALWWRDDMGKFFTPSFNSIIYPNLAPQLFDNYARLNLKHADCFIGFIIPFLFVISIVLLIIRRKKQNVLLGFLSLFFFMLTSPEILVYVDKIGFFPTSVFHFIPIINNARIPERFVVMFALFFAPYIFSLLQSIKWSNKKLAFIIPISIFCLIFLEYFPSDFGLNKKNDYPKWATILKEKPPGNLLPLPTGINDGNKAVGFFPSEQLYYQTIHKHKIVGGYISRIEDKLRNKFKSDKVMNYLLELSGGGSNHQQFDDEQLLRFIKKYKVEYIVLKNSDKTMIDFVEGQLGSAVSLQKEQSDDVNLYSVL